MLKLRYQSVGLASRFVGEFALGQNRPSRATCAASVQPLCGVFAFAGFRKLGPFL